METLLLSTKGYEKRTSIRLAAEAIHKGQLVAFPTETVYGLAANIFDEKAVRRIFKAKGRPSDNPLIVHVDMMDMARSLMMSVPRRFELLAEVFWPGPLTMVMKRNAAVLDVVTAGLDTVGVRMPKHPIARALIREAGVPLAAPSANRSGRPSPTTAPAAFDEMRGRIHSVLDGGACTVGIESTVLDLTRSVPRILRPGAITREMLEDLLHVHVTIARAHAEKPASPGMKYMHYAPEKPLHLVRFSDRMKSHLDKRIRSMQASGKRVGVIAPEALRLSDADEFYSMGAGDAVTYARRLYDAFHVMDRSMCDVILIAGIEPIGLGLAVMNRIEKAAVDIRE